MLDAEKGGCSCAQIIQRQEGTPKTTTATFQLVLEKNPCLLGTAETAGLGSRSRRRTPNGSRASAAAPADGHMRQAPRSERDDISGVIHLAHRLRQVSNDSQHGPPGDSLLRDRLPCHWRSPHHRPLRQPTQRHAHLTHSTSRVHQVQQHRSMKRVTQSRIFRATIPPHPYTYGGCSCTKNIYEIRIDAC